LQKTPKRGSSKRREIGGWCVRVKQKKKRPGGSANKLSQGPQLLLKKKREKTERRLWAKEKRPNLSAKNRGKGQKKGGEIKIVDFFTGRKEKT